jgi:phosphoenolpyruvate carboxykinase (ATP)
MINPLDLTEYGIENVSEIVYNPSFNTLFAEETKPGLIKSEKGIITKSGAIAVNTGDFTYYSPQDKYIVLDEKTKNSVWWKSEKARISDNKPVSQSTWEYCKNLVVKELSGKKIYVVDCYCGANADTRVNVRFIIEVAWQAHFVKNMFIRPDPKELVDFKHDFLVLNSPNAINPEWEKLGFNSGNFILSNLTEGIVVIGGIGYGGEMKKVIFSVMNYYLPLRGIASMNCSANVGKKGDVTLFFGLSGTGKTTLSTVPERELLGDDEHGWDDEGIFNLEGGCYAKCYRLSKRYEPDIHNAIRRDALLENLVVLPDGTIDFNDISKTENTRVSYPIFHINNIVKPVSRAGHAKNIIFLSTDTFGVLPSVSRLTEEQAIYYFLSGYSARVAASVRGIAEPVPLFSACFGSAYLMLNPIIYANELARKMKMHKADVWLVNTGWMGGSYGTGSRIDLPSTRRIISAIVDDSITKCDFINIPVFNLSVPINIDGIDENILDPGKLWDSRIKWHIAATDLAMKFINNFSKFAASEDTAKLAYSGPRI